jgi:hypothetical protein
MVGKWEKDKVIADWRFEIAMVSMCWISPMMVKWFRKMAVCVGRSDFRYA